MMSTTLIEIFAHQQAAERAAGPARRPSPSRPGGRPAFWRRHLAGRLVAFGLRLDGDALRAATPRLHHSDA